MTDDVRYKWRGLTWSLTEHGAGHRGLYVSHHGAFPHSAVLVAIIGPGLPDLTVEDLARSHCRYAVDKLRNYPHAIQAIPYPLDLLLIEDDDAFIAALCAYEATA